MLDYVATLGGMKRHGTRVVVSCAKCRLWKPFDVDVAIAKLGEDYSLVDKRAHCREPGCDGIVRFHGSPGEGSPFRPIIRR